VIEVLSDSTAKYDRGEKLAQYKQIESLQAVLLFSQTSHRVELHERIEHDFRTAVVSGDQPLKIARLDIEIVLSSIYSAARL
jgi:hypothetical protein